MKLLDCTLRDGGYYTNWDFNKGLVDEYINAINSLPVDVIEIGYRSQPQKDYLGEYFYCPQYVIDHITATCTKKVAIMFNEKDVRPEMLDDLLSGCEKVDMIRMAIDPDNFERALVLANSIKKRGFEVALNVMYMSNWSDKKRFMELVSSIDGQADYLNMVDSYGGVYPEDVKNIYSSLKEKTNITIGFHGHNNLELGLINSLTAIDCGAGIIDATITGMGRGAGNLKMELLLTALNSKFGLDVDFNVLGKVVSEFEDLKEKYNWGTNLPYMIAGSNSFPQKDVMNWVTNRFYSYNSIIRTLQNKKDGKQDNIQLPILKEVANSSSVLIIGGGPSAVEHSKGVIEFLNQNEEIVLIHASSKNAQAYRGLKNRQIFCLVGNEGHRLEANFENLNEFSGECILPPFPRKMGTYIPEKLQSQCFELSVIDFTNVLRDTHTAIALQTAKEFKADNIFFIGYDGYHGEISPLERELFVENETLFESFKRNYGKAVVSLLPTEYSQLEVQSLYAKI